MARAKSWYKTQKIIRQNCHFGLGPVRHVIPVCGSPAQITRPNPYRKFVWYNTKRSHRETFPPVCCHPVINPFTAATRGLHCTWLVLIFLLFGTPPTRVFFISWNGGDGNKSTWILHCFNPLFVYLNSELIPSVLKCHDFKLQAEVRLEAYIWPLQFWLNLNYFGETSLHTYSSLYNVYI